MLSPDSARAATFGRGAIAADEARSLSFYHIHTAEKLTVVYSENGELDSRRARRDQSLPARLSHEQSSTTSTSALLDALHGALRRVRAARQLRGDLRLPLAADQRRAAARDAAASPKNSLHIQGRAIDVRLTSAKTTGKLRDAALALQAGGVGYYRRVEFRPHRYRRRPHLVVAARARSVRLPAVDPSTESGYEEHRHHRGARRRRLAARGSSRGRSPSP